MNINANTRIGDIIKHNPASLDAIISINSMFSKLRNPILRKAIASRTSIATAAKLGKCSIDDFYEKLLPLGFNSDKERAVETVKYAGDSIISHITEVAEITTIDVRPILEAGEDPLKKIMFVIKTLNKGNALKIVNSFEPTPLIHLLSKQGFSSDVQWIDENTVETIFYKKENTGSSLMIEQDSPPEEWTKLLERFATRLKTIDVRNLPMPQPMMLILQTMDTIQRNEALHVLHKKVPVFLLPELVTRQYRYLINQVSSTEVELLIYKD